jgi:tryptophan-rich sensory protein
VFFALHETRVALAIIIVLAIAIAATIVAASRTQRLAALLLVPYLTWIAYATTVNDGIAALNF